MTSPVTLYAISNPQGTEFFYTEHDLEFIADISRASFFTEESDAQRILDRRQNKRERLSSERERIVQEFLHTAVVKTVILSVQGE